MSQIGTYLLLFGLTVAGYGLIAAAVGAKSGRPALVESARRCAFGLVATMVAANATMMVALLTNDFAIRYVAEIRLGKLPPSLRHCRCGPPTTVRCCSGISSWRATSPPSHCDFAATGQRRSRTR